jgi:hypothetical protein
MDRGTVGFHKLECMCFVTDLIGDASWPESILPLFANKWDTALLL